MGQKNRGGDWWKVLVGVGVLYYLVAGRGEEKNAPRIPDKLEARIDSLVTALNRQFGKAWVNFGLDVLRFYIANTLPGPAVALVNIIHNVELLSKYNGMTSHQKQQMAADWARKNLSPTVRKSHWTL